jgi:hypothetical protein
MNFAGLSQSTEICLPDSSVRKILIAAEQKKVLAEQVKLLEQRISIKEDIIRNLNSKDSVTVLTFQTQINEYKEQKLIYDQQLNSYEKLLRRQKRKTFFATFGGLLTTGITTFLLIKK